MNMHSPLVSIIIPCYNYGNLLAITLHSLLNQSYSNWECIVVDDGSKDNTSAVVSEMALKDNRYRYIYQENRGQAAARNKGLLNARGKYVQFLDADDFLENYKLEKQVLFLEKNAEVDIVYGEVRYFKTEQPNEFFLDRWLGINNWMPGISGGGEELVEAFVHENIMELGCILFKKEVLQEVGQFDEEIQGVEDWDLCVRCALLGKKFNYQPFPETRVLMRLHPASFSKQSQRMRKAMLIFRNKLSERLEENPPLKKLNKYNLVLNLGKPAFNEISNGNLMAGLKGVFLNMRDTKKYFYNLKLGSYWLGVRVLRRGKKIFGV